MITLPAGVAISIIAFLLALLPAGLLIWIWYLRRNERSVKGSTVAAVFVMGLLLVFPAFWLEEFAGRTWVAVSPGTAHYYIGAILPLRHWPDVGWPAFGTFFIVATIEEGLRYILLWSWIRYYRSIDQVFDGLVMGVAAGLGFATLENSWYFLDFFARGHFDTLVFVFFLRFIISTVAHIIFGGIMGTLLARATFSFYHRRTLYFQAFFLTWLAHGFYDLFLGINYSVYAVLLLLPLLLVLMNWSGRRDFLVIQRKHGQLLAVAELPQSKKKQMLQRFLAQFDSPWNRYAPWLRERGRQEALLHQLERNE